MVRLSNDAFLTQLSALFAGSQTKGSVFISVKPCACAAAVPLVARAAAGRAVGMYLLSLPPSSCLTLTAV